MTTEPSVQPSIVDVCVQHSKASPDACKLLVQFAKYETRPALAYPLIKNNPTLVSELTNLGEITVSVDTDDYKVTLACPDSCRNWGQRHELNPLEPLYEEKVNLVIANDDRLSFRARGVALFLLSNPGDKVSSRRIAGYSPKEERDAVESALKELIQYDYLRHLSSDYAGRMI